MTKLQARRDYIFKGDLYTTPLVLTTLRHKQGWMTVLENLPVFTIRGGSYKQDVLAIEKSKAKALRYHARVIRGEV